MLTMKTGVCGIVTANGGKSIVANAQVQLLALKGKTRDSATGHRNIKTDAKGRYCIPCPLGDYKVECSAFGHTKSIRVEVKRSVRMVEAPPINLALSFALALHKRKSDRGKSAPISHAVVGQPAFVSVEGDRRHIAKILWSPPPDARVVESEDGMEVRFGRAGRPKVEATIIAAGQALSPSRAELAPAPPSQVRMTLRISVS